MSDDRLKSDEELAEQLRHAPEGDLRGFEVLVERYRQKVKANCRYMTRLPADAEDLTQEVFVKAFFAIHRFEGRSSFKTWIQKIKVNHCLNYLKKHQDRTFVDVEDPEFSNAEGLVTEPAAPLRMEAASAREKISRILDAMSDKLRVPLLMRDMDQLSYQEISETLGIGLSAVKMRIKRAREIFRSLHAGRAGTAGQPTEQA